MRYIKYILITLTLLMPLCAMSQDDDDPMQDSLYKELCAAKDDYKRLDIMVDIARTHPNLDTVKYYAQKAVALAQKLGSSKYEILANSYLGWQALASSNYEDAPNYIFRAMNLSDSIGDKKELAYGYALLGDSYMLTNDVSLSTANYQKAIDIYNEINDKNGISEVLVQMAQLDNDNMMYETAIECIEKARKIAKEENDTVMTGRCYAILGAIYHNKYCNTSFTHRDTSLIRISKKYTYMSLKYLEESPHAYSNSVNRYVELLMHELIYTNSPVMKAILLDSCKIYLDRSVSLSKQYNMNYPESQIIDWLAISKQYDKAYALADSILKDHHGDYEYFRDNDYKFFRSYARLNELTGNYSNAIWFYCTYHELVRNKHEGDFVANAARSMAKNEFDQQIREREVRYETETNMRNAVIIFISIFLIMAIALVFVVIRDFRKSRTINALLDVQNEELSTINKEMTDGIDYACVIQKAALPSEEQLNETFGPHLLANRPLKTISGDFYWSTQIGRYKFLAVADSTGHAVPGALLSMLGITILNELATRVNINNPSAGDMLNDMRQAFKDSLHQNGSFDENHDGIDIALIIIDSQNLTMRYAGAFRPAVIIRDNQYIKLKADRMPIGSHYNETKHFTDHTFQLREDDVVYLYTDGMTDQYGFDEAHNFKKFTARRFRDMLLRIHNIPLDQQKEQLTKAYTKWRTINNSPSDLYEQTDDALIIGIKIGNEQKQ